LDATIDALILAANAGDRDARQRLFASLYEELHRLARRAVHRQGNWVTVGATTLLHEAYLDFSRRDNVTFPDRARFLSYAAQAMHGLIIDYARNRHAQKRGGGIQITSLDGAELVPDIRDDEIEKVSDALESLYAVEPALAEVVALKFYCGLSFTEIAELSGASERTVQRNWQKARIYLHGILHPAQ
jgi:RNA polymerase sigma factor (TIGR02999 family)